MKGLGNFGEHARGDPVGPFLIFLNLLETDPDTCAKLGLRNSIEDSSFPDGSTDSDVDGGVSQTFAEAAITRQGCYFQALLTFWSPKRRARRSF
jgi:hypothetical protein